MAALDETTPRRSPDGSGPTEVEVAILGSGFSGLGTAIRLKQQGIDDFVILEREREVGGTWQVNTYPGCGCDVPSHLYSFSFAPNPDWSRTYSLQPEIRDYLRRCADRFGVRQHVRFDHEVTGATWDEDASRWEVETSGGAVRARVLVAAAGPLSEPRTPDIPGLDDFEGPVFHSARWDHDYDLAGKRVASIGTGASAIQYVPAIQPEVEQLHVFQRTPPWVVPHTDRPVTRVERRLFRLLPALQRLVRRGRLRGARDARARLREEPPRDEARRATRPAPHAEADPRPAAPRARHARLHHRLQAHPAVQQVVPGAVCSPTSSSSPRGSNESRHRRS